MNGRMDPSRRSHENQKTRWTVQDLLVVLFLAVLIGVLYGVGLTPLSLTLSRVSNGNWGIVSLTDSLWVLRGLIPMALVRKPGALLVGGAASGFAELCFVSLSIGAVTGLTGQAELQNEAGQIMTRDILHPAWFAGVRHAAGGEMVFCLTRYVRWDLPTWSLAGAACGAFLWAGNIYVIHSYIHYGWQTSLAMLVTLTFFAAFLAGVLGWIANRSAARR